MTTNIQNSDIWIVIPAYNEGQMISNTIRSLRSLNYSVLVVDDGSTDNTAQAVRELQVPLVQHSKNKGQGAAFRTGIEWALKNNAAIIVTYDADGQMTPEDISNLAEPILQGKADITLGTRFQTKKAIDLGFMRWLALKLAIAFTRCSTGLKITDTHNGLRALSQNAARQLRISHSRMAHASDFIQQISIHGWRYQEVPVTIRYTPYSKQKGQKLWNLWRILWDLMSKQGALGLFIAPLFY